MIVGGMMYDSYSRAVFTFIIHLTWTDSDLVMYSLYTEMKETLDKVDKQTESLRISLLFQLN